MQPAAVSALAELRLTLLERQVAELTTAIETLRHGIAPAAGLSATLGITADDIGNFGVGFYPREFDGRGVPFRWTGNGDYFELRAVLDRSVPRRLELRLRTPRAEALDPLAVFVDYVQVEAELVASGADVVLRCPLPAAPSSGRVVVTVHAPNTAVHKESVPGQTGCPVGVMFFAAVVAPTPGTRPGAPQHG